VADDDYKALPENAHGVGRALEPEQEKLLLDTAREKPDWNAAFLAALASSNTTMRSHELKRLRLRDVDLIAEQVSVRKSETEAGERMIPLNAAAKWALRDFSNEQACWAVLNRNTSYFLVFDIREEKPVQRRKGPAMIPNGIRRRGGRHGDRY
jgi:integrase